jgi:hypothetical protein
MNQIIMNQIIDFAAIGGGPRSNLEEHWLSVARRYAYQERQADSLSGENASLVQVAVSLVTTGRLSHLYQRTSDIDHWFK